MDEKAYVYSCNPKPAARSAYALLGAALCAAGVLFCTSSLQLALWALIVLETLAWSACDMQARLLPTPLTVAFAATAAAWQLALGGQEALIAGLAVAAGCFAVFGGTTALWLLLGHKWIFGKGDLKLVVPVGLACGFPGMYFGFGALVAACILWFIYMAVRGELSRGATLPFGPMLAAAALAGCAGGAWCAGAVLL